MVIRSQYRKLMKKYQKTGNVSQSAEHSGMTAKTARKYICGGFSDDSSKRERDWRTRADPFDRVWLEVVKHLEAMRSGQCRWVKAKELFDELMLQYPAELSAGMLRSFQRRVSEWKQLHACDEVAEVYFEQVHIPGHFLELDWFHSREMEVSIQGVKWKHLLCHTVLTYSNWEWVEPCQSESFASLKSTLQSTVFELGYVPQKLKTDNSSTATHDLKKIKATEQEAAKGGKTKRCINAKLSVLLEHFGMGFQSIQVGKPNENGDVESANGHLRRYLLDRLSLRGHGDFNSIEAYRQWLHEQLRARNLRRQEKLNHEIAKMKKLVSPRLPEYERVNCSVNKYGLVRIGKGSYSVPRQWRHLRDIEGRLFDERVEIWGNGKVLASFETQPNLGGARIDYRHLLVDLLRKPGAFMHYRYREEFVPGEIWRLCFDQFLERRGVKLGSKEYLLVLGLTLENDRSAVEKALYRLLATDELSLEKVKELLGIMPRVFDHKDYVPEADLTHYDTILTQGGAG